ncbi:hypothetical protein QBK99_19160 [Corticibacterium sp. UT-5YL-CI-8]|nr:hypothetical protein [Tianweitania sp. UT-5YL-CI-8]
MTPLTVLATATDIYTARTVLDALKTAGWIVVRHDAIKLAQAHSRADNDNNERYTD